MCCAVRLERRKATTTFIWTNLCEAFLTYFLQLQWVVQMHNMNITIPISTDTDTQNSFKYQLDKPATNIWRLKIQNIQVSDEGLYICRVQLHNFQFANISRMIKVIRKFHTVVKHRIFNSMLAHVNKCDVDMF